MKCEICNNKDASTVIHRDGKELYVCKDCAAENSSPRKRKSKKIETPDLPEKFQGKIHIHGDEPPPEIMDALLKATMKFVEGISRLAPESEQSEEPTRCPECNATWDEIDDLMLIKCPACYRTFASRIRKEMLASQYGKRHIGNSPEGANIQRDIESLKRKLRTAVKKEQYEVASKIQKQIDELTRKAKGEA